MPSLSISGLTKTFGKFKAVDDFSLEVASGTVHSLVGENGAGKIYRSKMHLWSL